MVTLTPVDDEKDEANETATFTHTTSGGDYGSNNVAANLVLTITDDDETPVITGSTAVSFDEIEYDADPATVDLEVATYSGTDGDGDDITWTLTGTDSALFSLVEDSDGDAVLSFVAAPDFENPSGGTNNVYTVTVEASDGTNKATRAVTVTVVNVNENPYFATDATTPVAVTSAARSYAEHAYDTTAVKADLLVGFKSGSTDIKAIDPEGQTIAWTLGGADAGDFSIERRSAAAADFPSVFFRNQPDFEDPADSDTDNVYNLAVRASDGTNRSEIAFTVTVTDINERPAITEDAVSSYAEIEFDSTATPPAVHTFTATDHDHGDSVAWSLEGDDAGDFEINSSTGVLTFVQASGSRPRPNFEAPADDDSLNTYEVTVKATDDDSSPLSSTYAVTVTVTNVNEKPRFTGTPSTAISQDENEAASDELADYDAEDQEGGVTWDLSGTDAGDFGITTDGVVTFEAVPDYEDPEDSDTDNVYTFNVVATDLMSGSTRRTNSVAVTVTVVDVEEAGVVEVFDEPSVSSTDCLPASGAPRCTTNANPGVGDSLRFYLSDPDGGLTASLILWYFEQRASSSDSWTVINAGGGTSSTTFAAFSVTEDHTGKQLRARAVYADRRSTTTDDTTTPRVDERLDKTAASDASAAVTADPIANAPPRFATGFTLSITEGDAGRDVGSPVTVRDRDGDTITYAVAQQGNHEYFEINSSSGQLRLARAVDYESADTTPIGDQRFLSVTVEAHDGKGVDTDNNEVDDTTVDATESILVEVIDIEEPGTVALSAREPETGTELEATLTDGDGDVSGEVWRWARSANGRTDWFDIAAAAASTYTPVDADEDFYLRARVTYSDNRGSGKSAQGVTTRPVPSLNRRPAFPDSETGARAVDENTRANTNIGAPVAAVDPESDRLTYTLTGTDAAAFTVVASTGQLRVSDALDFEAKDSYSLTVNVHDGRDGMGSASTAVDDTVDVTVTVNDLDEAGTVTLTTPTGAVQARVRDHRRAHRPRRRRRRRRLAVVPVAQRPHRLGQHRGCRHQHLHPRRRPPAQTRPGHGHLHRRQRHQQGRPRRVGPGGRAAAGQLAAGVPLHRDRRARSPPRTPPPATTSAPRWPPRTSTRATPPSTPRSPTRWKAPTRPPSPSTRPPASCRSRPA